jgi:putative aldouronate transport system permease protein
MINILAVSLSSSASAMAGLVKFWPVGFTTQSYEYVIQKKEFLTSMVVSVKRLALGISLQMLLTILVAYPLSKEDHTFRFKKIYVWFFMITILFGGGLIPWYLTINATGLMDSIWALVIPGAVPVFHVIILLNFFRGIPSDISDAAFIDGAGHWKTLWKIYVPLSMPALATLTLFSAVGHWNSWFDGIILMNKPGNLPVQSYLQTVVSAGSLLFKHLSAADLLTYSQVNDRTAKAAQIFVAAVPILAVYPFLQRYFMTGIVLGSVKG